MKNFIYLILLMAGMFSCKAHEKATSTETSVSTTTVTETFVPVTIPNDSLYLSALFTCDSAGKVLMDELFEYKSKSAKSSYVFHDGKLAYKYLFVHDTIYVPTTNIVTNTEKVVTVTNPPITIKEPPTWWQSVLMWLGAISLFIITILSTIYIYRRWKRK